MIGDRIEVNIAGGLDLPLPKVVRVRQKFSTTRIEDIPAAIAEEFKRPGVGDAIRPGAEIAVGCGSRGVANIAKIAKAVVTEVKARGGRPFIFPAMGSHGAATAAGQTKVLNDYGITEAFAGCEIRSEMEPVQVGNLNDGTPIFADRHAAAADGVILINRVKPHTTFRGPTESGLTKMCSIGIGKIRGAASIHTQGMEGFAETLPAAAAVVQNKVKVMFGVAVVENAEDDTAIIEAIPVKAWRQREPELLVQAKERMARLLFDQIDVLVIDEAGKNISGTGFDPNVTGRNKRNVAWPGGPSIQKIAVLSLTEQTHGNATGIGSADVITLRVYQALDVGATYANVITGGYLDGAAIPIIMNTDRDAVALAVKTLIRVKPQDARIVHIRNTLQMIDIEVSEPMLAEVRARPDRFEILGQAQPLAFDAAGRLRPIEH
jgi:hypothetical protein